MTLQQYLDPEAFPLTTLAWLAPLDQLLVDGFLIDRFEGLHEEGRLRTADQRAAWQELRRKARCNRRLTRELAGAKARDGI